MVGVIWKGKYRGQKQKWFLFKLKENTQISFENDPDNEFDDSGDFTKWDVNRLARQILANRCYELVGRNPNYLFRKIR